MRLQEALKFYKVKEAFSVYLAYLDKFFEVNNMIENL